VLLVGLAAGVVVDSVVELRPVIDLLRLSPAVWERGHIWRVVTYGFVGTGPISAWSLVELVLVYWCAMELLVLLGLARTRTLILGGVAIAGLAAVAGQALSDAVDGPACVSPFWMMQGQHIILAIALPVFATRNRWSTVAHTPYLLGLPIPTRWLVPLQLLAALGAFATTRDFGGFIGIAAATIWGLRFNAR
jgi:hypothetical protein